MSFSTGDSIKPANGSEPNQIDPDVQLIDGQLQWICELIEKNDVLIMKYKYLLELYDQYCIENSIDIKRLTIPGRENIQPSYVAKHKQLLEQINQNRNNCLHSIQMIVDQLDDIKCDIIGNRLNKWKTEQILLAGYGDRGPRKLTNSLHSIHIQFNALFHCIFRTFTQLNTIFDLKHQTNFIFPWQLETKLKLKITKLIEKTVCSSFILEEQPPQIIKKDKK